MQYFAALRAGQRRVAAAREYLNGVSGGRAMPALALRGGGGPWEPVGEEMLWASVDESPGFVLTDSSGHIVAIVDAAGTAKAVVQGVAGGERDAMARAFAADGTPEFRGRVVLPV